jgi:ABC-type branched-subunit amino acid transport system substrate-binding protein
LYGRRVELRTLRSAAAFDREDVFALVGGVPDGSIDLAALAESREIPLVAPLAGGAGGAPGGRRFVFHLYPGRRERALALASFAARLLPREQLRALVIHSGTPEAAEAAQALERRATDDRWAALQAVSSGAPGFDAKRAAREAAQSGCTAVFALGGAAGLGSFLAEAARSGLAPAVFVDGEAVGRGIFDIPRDFRGEIHVAFSSGPPSAASEQGRAFYALTGRLGLPPGQRAFQAWAYAAGRIAIEGLRAAGRGLDRERFLVALEGLNDFEAGAPHRVRFGPLRRVGLAGATIARLDVAAGRLVPEREWESAEP